MGKNLLKTGNAYGAMVAHRPVFTRQGAIDRYKISLEVAYKDFDLAAAHFLTEVEDDLIRIGFTPEELEGIEIEYLRSL